MVNLPVADRLQQVQEYYFSQKLRQIEQMNLTGDKVINLGIGSPDLPPHPDVIETLHAESSKPNTHAYQSYKGAPALREAIAGWYSKWYGVELNPEQEILPLIGSKEGITHICMTYLNPGDTALVPDPGYPAYASAVKVSGGMPVTFALTEQNDYLPDLDELTALLKQYPQTKLLFLNYPNMPTGKQPDIQFFERMVGWALLHNILIVHDNPYSFILNDNPISMLALPGSMGCVLELNSLSKSHNLAGWRVGMLLGSQARLQEVLRFKSNLDSGMFLPVQLAAAKALQLPDSWYSQLNVQYTQRRTVAFDLLNMLECTYSTTQTGMFVWAKVPLGKYADGYALADEVLLLSRVFITPGGIFGQNGNPFIRISLCSTVDVFGKAIERIAPLFSASGHLA
jgi:aspartate/methionine/tyrosine aminotransferase